jgi:hypothetical protein
VNEDLKTIEIGAVPIPIPRTIEPAVLGRRAFFRPAICTLLIFMDARGRRISIRAAL